MAESNSRALAARMARLVAAAGLTGAGVWLGRLLAHSKVPPPEGRWREVFLEKEHPRS